MSAQEQAKKAAVIAVRVLKSRDESKDAKRLAAYILTIKR
jgi:hypothetical protein